MKKLVLLLSMFCFSYACPANAEKWAAYAAPPDESGVFFLNIDTLRQRQNDVECWHVFIALDNKYGGDRSFTKSRINCDKQTIQSLISYIYKQDKVVKKSWKGGIEIPPPGSVGSALIQLACTPNKALFTYEANSNDELFSHAKSFIELLRELQKVLPK